MKLNDIKKNIIAKKIIENSLKNKKISHAYIITGETDSPKESLAEIFAKGILCKKDPTPIFTGNSNDDTIIGKNPQITFD